MAEYNHFCKVCGKGYNACDTCVNQMDYAAWRAIACTQDHFQAYMVLYEYGNGTLKKADAKEMLSKVNVDGWEGYAAHNRDVIAEILAEDEQNSLRNPLALAIGSRSAHNNFNRGMHGDSLLMLAPTGASNRKPLPLGMGYITGKIADSIPAR